MSDTIVVALITGGVTLVNVVFTAVFNMIRDRKHKQNDRMANVEKGLQSLLRSELIKTHDKYTDKKYCPVYAREVVSNAYEAYHALGGNGVITQLYGATMALPTEPPDGDAED